MIEASELRRTINNNLYYRWDCCANVFVTAQENHYDVRIQMLDAEPKIGAGVDLCALYATNLVIDDNVMLFQMPMNRTQVFMKNYAAA